MDTLRRAGRDERVRVSYELPSDGRSVRHLTVYTTPTRSEAKTPGGHLDRHRTGRDVLLREKCTPSADATRATRARRPRPRTSNQRTCAVE